MAELTADDLDQIERLVAKPIMLREPASVEDEDQRRALVQRAVEHRARIMSIFHDVDHWNRMHPKDNRSTRTRMAG